MRRPNQKVVVAVVYVSGMIMNSLDSTIVNVALATLSREFDVTPAAIESVVIGYLVSLAVFIPASGWLGDRFGTTCHGRIVAATFSHFARAGRLAAHNRPYAGDYVLQRHGLPKAGLHAFQLEIDRRAYLDDALAEPGEGLGGLVELLSALVLRLGGDVAALGRAARGPDWAEAAE